MATKKKTANTEPKRVATVMGVTSIAESLARDWENVPAEEKTYALRTISADRRSQQTGWKWPSPGIIALAPDWNQRDECGGGLHGLLHGCGNHDLISFDNSAIGQVVQVISAEVLEITASGGGKVKFPRCVEVFTGTLREAVSEIKRLDPLAAATHLPFAIVGETRDGQTAAVPSKFGAASATGYSGAASATGYRGAASATGYSGAASATGDRGAASATGDRGAASATGDRGAASATGYRGAASATGDSGAAIGRHETRVRANDDGILILIDDSGARPRASVHYVGEDGIKPNTFYKLRAGVIVESPDNDPEYDSVALVSDLEAYVAERLSQSESLKIA